MVIQMSNFRHIGCHLVFWLPKVKYDDLIGFLDSKNHKFDTNIRFLALIELEIEAFQWLLRYREIWHWRQIPNYFCRPFAISKKWLHIPLYNSPHRNRKHHVNLLLIMDEKNCSSHYLLIRSLSRLVGNRTKHNGAIHVCPYCLYCFKEEHHLTSHIPACSVHAPQHFEYPSPKHDGDTEYNILKVKNFAKTLPVPMALYCDFETFLVPVEDNGTASKIVTKELHKPIGFCCLPVAQDSKYTGDIFTHSGPDVMVAFFNHLKQQEEFVSDALSKVVKMNPLTEEEQMIHIAELQALW